MSSTHSHAQKMVAAYERLIPVLSLEKTGHFFGRVMNATGDTRYTNLLAYHFMINKIPAFAKELHTLRAGTYEAPRKPPPPGTSGRKRLRRELYRRSPRIHFFNQTLNDLFFIQKYGLHTRLKKSYAETLQRLRKENLPSLYQSEEVIRFDSSYAFNSAFYMTELGIASADRALEQMFRDMYLDSNGNLKTRLSDDEFCSVVYSMTHIIIAHSRYYERSVRGYEWILQFFSRYEKDILKKTTTDILAEVALCYTLCKAEERYRAAVRHFQQPLLKILMSISKETDDRLIANEHTNSILFLLFAGNTRWHPSPNLSSHPVFQSLPPFYD